MAAHLCLAPIRTAGLSERNFFLAVWPRGCREGIWQGRARVRDTPGHTELLKVGFSPGLSLVSHQTRLPILPALDHAGAYSARSHQERTSPEASNCPGREGMLSPG